MGWPHRCDPLKYAWFESRTVRDSKPEQDYSDLIISQNAMIPKEFARFYSSNLSDDDLDSLSDEMAEYFLGFIRKDTPIVDIDILEDRLKIKYQFDSHSATVLNGRTGLHVIVDHGLTSFWSEINCRAETRMFEKCGFKILRKVKTNKIYSYLVKHPDNISKLLQQIPKDSWVDASKLPNSIPQDMIGEITKTAKQAGYSIDDVLQLIAENAYILQLKPKTK